MQKNANITPIQVVTKREMAMDENKELRTIYGTVEPGCVDINRTMTDPVNEDIPAAFIKEVLLDTCTEIVVTTFSEEKYQEIKMLLEYSPYVFYSAGPLEKYDMLRITDNNLDPWKNEKRYFESRRF